MMGFTRSAPEPNITRPMSGISGNAPAWLTGNFSLALGGALVALATSWVLDFPSLAAPGADNDSILRLVQVRDLLAGQGWFDLHQYRMGAEGGFVMHWSRLVDAPIAGLILLFRPIFGGSAEIAAQIVWPTMLMALSLLALLRAAHAYDGAPARFPALVLGTAAFYFMGIFASGALDHHNLQLTLVLAMAAWLIDGRSFRTGAAAGAVAAVSMTIGMETIPYVAAAGASVALLFWLRGERQVPIAAGFGIGFAALAVLSLALTIRPAAWFSTTCDAFSGAQAGSAVLAGVGMAAAAAFTGKRRGIQRLAALAALAIASATFVLLVYPQCLADPYGSVPPRLRDYWLGDISEAQSLLRLLADKPETVALYYATPTIALALAAWRLLRGEDLGKSLPVALLLFMALAVSAWQVRGAIFALSLAVIPLSAWVGATRIRAASAPSTAATLQMTAAWLLSLNVAWGIAGLLVFDGSENEKSAEATACHAAQDFAGLAELPTGNVLAISNLGASILAHSDHRVLAGPYHRNEDGNLAMLDAMVGTPAEALEIARRYEVSYVAVCPGNPETRILAGRAPDGLLASIGRGEPVEWLKPVAGTEAASLQVFRVTDRWAER